MQTSRVHVTTSVTVIMLVPVVTAVTVLAPFVNVVVPSGQVVVVYVRVVVETPAAGLVVSTAETEDT